MNGRLLSAVLATSLPLAGCGACVEFATEKALEKAGVEIDEAGQRITIKGKDGEVIELSGAGESGTVHVRGKDGEEVAFAAEGEGKLPKDFPFAVADGAKVQGSASVNDARTRSVLATLVHTEGDAEKLVAFYLAELEKKGFEVERAEVEVDGKKLVTLTGKDGTRKAAVTIHHGGDEGWFTQISYREPK